MPRRNKQVKHIPFRFTNNEAGKTRYATKRQAEEAAEYRMLTTLNLTLYVYQSSIDKGWYLTSAAPQ